MSRKKAQIWQKHSARSFLVLIAMVIGHYIPCYDFYESVQEYLAWDQEIDSKKIKNTVLLVYEP